MRFRHATKKLGKRTFVSATQMQGEVEFSLEAYACDTWLNLSLAFLFWRVGLMVEYNNEAW